MSTPSERAGLPARSRPPAGAAGPGRRLAEDVEVEAPQSRRNEQEGRPAPARRSAAPGTRPPASPRRPRVAARAAHAAGSSAGEVRARWRRVASRPREPRQDRGGAPAARREIRREPRRGRPPTGRRRAAARASGARDARGEAPPRYPPRPRGASRPRAAPRPPRTREGDGCWRRRRRKGRESKGEAPARKRGRS